MRSTLKSINANCPASNLKNGKRLSDLVRNVADGYANADIMCLYLQIRLGAYSLLTGWLGHVRHAQPVRVPTTPVTPASPTATPIPGAIMGSGTGTSLLLRSSRERRDGRLRPLSFASIVR